MKKHTTYVTHSYTGRYSAGCQSRCFRRDQRGSWSSCMYRQKHTSCRRCDYESLV